MRAAQTNADNLSQHMLSPGAPDLSHCEKPKATKQSPVNHCNQEIATPASGLLAMALAEVLGPVSEVPGLKSLESDV